MQAVTIENTSAVTSPTGHQQLHSRRHYSHQVQCVQFAARAAALPVLTISPTEVHAAGSAVREGAALVPVHKPPCARNEKTATNLASPAWVQALWQAACVWGCEAVS